jgi:ABC-type phosphate transport system substrate-binding protein
MRSREQYEELLKRLFDDITILEDRKIKDYLESNGYKRVYYFMVDIVDRFFPVYTDPEDIYISEKFNKGNFKHLFNKYITQDNQKRLNETSKMFHKQIRSEGLIEIVDKKFSEDVNETFDRKLMKKDPNEQFYENHESAKFDDILEDKDDLDGFNF